MRNIFMAGAKLLGLLGVYWAILVIPQIGFVIGAQSRMEHDIYTRGWLWVYWVIGFLAPLLFGLALLFQTEKIADVLKIKDSGEQVAKPSSNELLRIGIILVGIFLLVSAIPQLAKTIFSMARLGLRDIYSISQLISTMLQIALGGWLTFSARKVINIIMKKEGQTT